MKALKCLRKFSPLVTHVFILLILICAFNSAKASFASSDQNLPELRIAYLPKQDSLDDTYAPEAHLTARMNILSKYFDNTFSLVPASFEPRIAMQLLDSGEANIIGLFVKSPERMYRLKFTKKPAAQVSLFIVTDEHKKIFYGDVQALKGKEIAVFSGNSMEKAILEEYLVENNISMNYRIYTSYEEYVRSDAEFHLTNSLYFIKGKQIVMRVGQQGFYFATLPKYAHLLDVIDNALVKAEQFDVKALRAVNNKYINKNIRELHHELSAEEAKIIENPSKVHQLGYSVSHYPILYQDEQGKAAGITQGVHLLFKQMHDTPNQLVPYEPDSAVMITQFDMLFSVVGHQALREKHFYASKPYANLPMVLFGNKNVDNSDIKSFGMLDYAVLDHREVQEDFPHWNMKVFSSLDKLFAAYENNKIDTILLSRSEAEYAFAKLGTSNNVLVPTSLVLPLRFYIAKKYTLQAANVIDAFIDKLNPIDVQRVILEAESMVYAPSTFTGMYEENKDILLSIAASVLLVLLSLHFFRLYLQKQKYYKLSLTDSLTKISTKENAYAIMQRALSKAYPDEYIVFCVDIDKFTLLNQIYGREKGDEVLIYFANYLKERYIDGYKAECLARVRDDIFLVFGKTKLLMEALEVSVETLSIVHEIENILQSNYSVSMSKGCYIIDDVTLPIETIVDYCHAARRMGKKEHALSTVFFDEEMKKSTQMKKDIIRQMEKALATDEFALFFQPKIRLGDEQICGAEVLVRWQPRNGNVMYPDDFISVFENNAFIAKLDLHVLEKTCQFIKENRDSVKLPPLAVNLSGLTILHSDTYMHIREITQHYGVAPHELEFEITESAMTMDTDAFDKNIKLLCRAGFVVAIDDFGSGVSSLHRLSTLCVHTMKLDKAFLDDKFCTKNVIFLVSSIITMLRRLGIQVVAKGVETERHVIILKKLYCDMAQGNHFYKALARQEFVDVLKSSSIQVKIAHHIDSNLNMTM